MVFGWLKNKGGARSPLGELLRNYPPAIPPHLGETSKALLGNGPRLTPEQALENFDWHNAVRPERLDILRGGFAKLGFEMDDAFDADRRPPMMQARDLLLSEEFAVIGSAKTRDMIAWETERPDGDYIVYSLLRDLAMLDEEVMLRCVSGATVRLNTDKRDADMASYMRPCVTGLVDRLFPNVTFCHDFAGSWFGFFSGATPDRLIPRAPRDYPGGYLAEVMDRYVAPDAARGTES